MSLKNYDVVCLKLRDGNYQPLAWACEQISKKTLRRLTRKFRIDNDYMYAVVMDWRRLYNSLEEMKQELNRLNF